MLVLAPHPDDEIFGCGGVLALAAREGIRIETVVVTDGGAQGDAAVRRAESLAAARRIGAPAPAFWGLPDRSLEPEDPGLLERLREAIEGLRPEVLLVPSPAEVHPDHRALALAVYRVAQELATRAPAWDGPGLAAYEVSAVLHPNLLVDVTEVWEDLLAAARAFASQLETAPYLEVFEAIATTRRLTLPAAVRRAEAYFVTDPGFVKGHSAVEWAARQGPVAGLPEEAGEIRRLRLEVERLRGILDEIQASRTWKLHRLLERLRGRA